MLVTSFLLASLTRDPKRRYDAATNQENAQTTKISSGEAGSGFVMLNEYYRSAKSVIADELIRIEPACYKRKILESKFECQEAKGRRNLLKLNFNIIDYRKRSN